ncbi:MAG: endonuclease/exonuclease/phosphatase family protein [Pirellulales bacterium]
MNPNRAHLIAATLLLLSSVEIAATAEEAAIRVATYNTSLFRDEPGQLVRDLEKGENEQARRIAEVIQRVRPDILLINEFDYDDAHRAAELFRTKYVAVSQNGCEPIEFDHHFTAPVNTGRPSGRDLDKDGRLGGPADAIGYGRHEGQYGMLLMSRFPIDRPRVRTFQKFLWRDMPRAILPNDPRKSQPFYNDDDLAVLRLSSKSFWDAPVEVPAFPAARGSRPFTLHLLCSHPTPPVFDGPEDRNGHRNHDEIRLIAEYIDDRGSYLVDDAGHRGELARDALFVILGDLNADPLDGESALGVMDRLLKHWRVNASFTPTSAGGPITVKQYADQHVGHRGDPAHVTSNFTGEGHGCLRIDYALPSRGLTVIGGGVFWPTPGEPGSEAVTASDHRPVWIDVRSADR